MVYSLKREGQEINLPSYKAMVRLFLTITFPASQSFAVQLAGKNFSVKFHKAH
jgi:hypothetical protein